MYVSVENSPDRFIRNVKRIINTTCEQMCFTNANFKVLICFATKGPRMESVIAGGVFLSAEERVVSLPAEREGKHLHAVL